MRFKTRRRQQQSSQLPAINLIPMLNVMIAVLGFFVLVSTSLSNEEGVNVDLPSVGEGEGKQASEESSDVLFVTIEQGQVLVENQPVTEQQALASTKAYLAENKEGKVWLKASDEIPYEQVMALLGKLRELDSERVGLGLDSDSELPASIQEEEEDFDN
ncbi:MAG: biopolymer transporter ExbD [Spirulinaceae cyanobacterium]